MTVAHHDPLVFGSGASSANLNRPLAELDAAITALEVEASGAETTLDGSAASGQKVVPVASTTGFSAGQTAFLSGSDGDSEGIVIASVSAGVSVTAVDNLVNSYASGDHLSRSPVELVLARGVFTSIGDRLSAGTTAAMQRLMRKLYRGTSDACILILSDSTGTGVTSWTRLLAEALADDHPAFSVDLTVWDDGTLDWGATTSISTGGDHTLTVLNGSVGTKSLGYFRALGEAMVDGWEPDLILVSLGHNESFGSSTQNTINGWRDRMLAVTETYTALAPFAGLCIVAQNPRVDDPDDTAEQVLRLSEWATLAERRGYGFIDVWQAFWDTGDPGALTSDGYHPTATGYQLWHDTLYRAFSLRSDAGVSAQQQSSLLDCFPNLLENGDFSSFASPPTLPGWTALSVTLSKDTSHVETANGWSVRMVASAATTSKIMTHTDYRAALAQRVRGHWVTLAARVYPAVGTYAGNLQLVTDAGQIGFSPGGGAEHLGRWQWHILSAKVPAAATTLYATVNCSSVGDATADVSVSRVTLVRGILPRDCQ